MLWVLATFAGLEIAFWCAFPVEGRLRFSLTQAGFEPQLVGLLLIPARLAISGGALGIAQWLVLRRHISDVGAWPIATTIGSLAAAPFAILLALAFHHLLMPPEALVYAILSGSVTGICIALGQLVVWRKGFPAPQIWLGAGLVGFGLAAVSTMALSVYLFLPFELNVAVEGGIAGAITGTALVRLVPQLAPPGISHPGPLHN
jgi:hypothetical protein